MDLFRLEKHNYWARNISGVWKVSQGFSSLNLSNMNITDQSARALVLLLFELGSNVENLLYAHDLDYIPIDTNDMWVARLLLNDFFQVNGLSYRVEVIGGGIRLVN